MGIWLTFFTYVASFILSELLRPKPKIENARPAGEDEFDFPTATEGRHVPIVIGKSQIGGPNVIWYGDILAVPITEQVKTGIFSKKNVTVGFEYFVAIQMALCRGEIDEVHRIWVGEKVVFDLTTSPTTGAALDSPATQLRIDQPLLFGGKDRSGGINGTFEFFYGATDAPISGFMASRTIPTPNYQNTCYCVFRDGFPVDSGPQGGLGPFVVVKNPEVLEQLRGVRPGGMIGQAPNIRPFKFEISRYPNNVATGGKHIIGEDANPIEFLYEILTDTDWGLGISAADINTSGTLEEGGFIAVANKVADEGLGFSAAFEQPLTARELIAEVERHVDGFFRLNLQTGFFEIILARPNTASPDPAVSVDETNIIQLKNFSRGTWSETENEVRVTFPDRAKLYNETHALAQDMANRLVQGRSPAQLRYPGIKTASVANIIAWREIRSMAFPIAKIKFEADRSLYLLQPGGTILWSWSDYGITDLRMRIIRIGYGTDKDEKIIVDAVEDIYNIETTAFSDPPASGWVPPVTDAVANTNDTQRLWQVPVALMTTLATRSTQQVATFVAKPSGLHTSYKVLVGPYESEVEDDYIISNEVGEFTPSGLLFGAMSKLDGGTGFGFGAPSPPGSVTIQIDNTSQIEEIVPFEFSTLATGIENLVLIDDEVIFFEDAVEGSPAGTYTLTGVRRGMLNSVPADHTDNTRIWFLTYGAGLTHDDDTVSGVVLNQTRSYKFINKSVTDEVRFDDAARLDVGITIGDELSSAFIERDRPYPANNLFLNDRRFQEYSLTSPENVTCGNLNFVWVGRNSERQVLTDLGMDFDQDDLHIDPQGGIRYRIEVFRTDTSPETSVFALNTIPSANDEISPEGGNYRLTPDRYFIGINDISSPVPSPEQAIKEYRIQFGASLAGTTGLQLAQLHDEVIQVTGYGLDYGENYGGICSAGVNLAQGDPPVSTTPIPGFEEFREYTITIGGTAGAISSPFDADEEQVISGFWFNALAWENGAYFVGGGNDQFNGLTSREIRDILAGEYAAVLPDIFSVNTLADPERVVISTLFGTLSGSFAVGTRTSTINFSGPYGVNIVQTPEPVLLSGLTTSAVYFSDWYDSVFDSFLGINVDVLAPSRHENYSNGRTWILNFQVRALTYAKQLELGFETITASAVVQSSNIAGESSYDINFDLFATDYNQSELGDFSEFSRSLIDNTGSAGGPAWSAPNPMSRAGIAAILDDNLIGIDFTYDQAPTQPPADSTFPYRLVWKANRNPTAVYPTGASKTVWINLFGVVPQQGLVSKAEFAVEVDGTIVATETATAADEVAQDFDRIRDSISTQLDGVAGFSSRIVDAGRRGLQLEFSKDAVNSEFTIHVYAGFGLQLKFEETT